MLGILGFGLAGLLLVAVPFLSGGARRTRRFDFLPVAGLAALLYMIVLSTLAYLG